MGLVARAPDLAGRSEAGALSGPAWDSVSAATGGPAAWIGARDPRARLIGAALLVLAVVALTDGTALAVAFGLALSLALLAHPDPRRLAGRLLGVAGLLLLLVATLPLTVPGEPVAHLGPFTVTDAGLDRAGLLLLTAGASVLAVTGLLGGMAPAALGHGLARLGAPESLAQLLVLTVRQVALLDAEHHRLRRAMRARAFRPRADLHTWRTFGWLIGMLLVRATARARRLMGAMRCRGYQGRLTLLHPLQWREADTLLVTACAASGALLLALDRLA